MSNSSSNPVAIITGGSRGVGAATAKLLASKGWNVTITCTSSIEDANNIVKECEELGVEALALTADVSNDELCRKTADETLSKWGRIDCLVNNAGTTKFVFNHADLEGLNAEDFLQESEHSISIRKKANSRKDFYLKPIQTNGLWDNQNPFKDDIVKYNENNKIDIIT